VSGTVHDQIVSADQVIKSMPKL